MWTYVRIALAGLAGIGLLGAGLFAVRLWSVLHAISPKAQPGDLISLIHQTDQPGSLGWKIKHDQRINILLLGYGGPGHDGPYLTDSIMLVSVRPASHEVIMISLPRDLWVKIPALPRNGSMWGKLNSAYAIGTDHADFPNVRSDWNSPTGGGDLAAATVSQITGQPIDYWIGVDFTAFRDVVNAVGGIRVNVPTALDDPYFPVGETTGMVRVHFDVGWQQFDGERALEYARSRDTTSDFDRSRRQQLIMLAVRQRVFSLNAVPKLFGLLTALQDNVRTNLRPAEMRQIADLTGRIKDADIRRVAVDTSNLLRSGWTRDGQYILQPMDISYAALQHFVAMALPDRLALTSHVAFQLQDGSRRYRVPYGAGTPASIMTSLFQSEGWTVTLGPAPVQRVVKTEIHDGSAGTASATVAWLQSYFDAVVVPVPTPSSGPSVTVVLGSDFTAKAFP